MQVHCKVLGFKRSCQAAIVFLSVVLLLMAAPLQAGEGESSPDFVENYMIGPQDILDIVVWDNEDLSGKVAVSLDGHINYQLIGKVRASGLTVGELAQRITELLADGYIINPQVNVRVVEYKSQKVFIMGEAARPGTYYLTKLTTIVEAISMAGGLTQDADTEAIIVRPSGNGTDNGEFGQIKVDIRSALEGNLGQNICVRNNDSIFIPKAKTFFIMGEVNKPGEYKLESGTTVRKAVSLSGGATEKASMGRARVIRAIDDNEVETRIGLDEPLQPNDTVIIPERFF
jgi:polysaccharide export outer membrane protein